MRKDEMAGCYRCGSGEEAMRTEMAVTGCTRCRILYSTSSRADIAGWYDDKTACSGCGSAEGYVPCLGRAGMLGGGSGVVSVPGGVVGSEDELDWLYRACRRCGEMCGWDRDVMGRHGATVRRGERCRRCMQGETLRRRVVTDGRALTATWCVRCKVVEVDGIARWDDQDMGIGCGCDGLEEDAGGRKVYLNTRVRVCDYREERPLWFRHCCRCSRIRADDLLLMEHYPPYALERGTCGHCSGTYDVGEARRCSEGVHAICLACRRASGLLVGEEASCTAKRDV
jgi:hypothetical protein